MVEFEFRNPARILFGEGRRESFLNAVKSLSDKALVVCGRHFARSGELGDLCAALEAHGVKTWEIPDIRSSTIEGARIAWKLCRAEGIGVVVAAGGATVMDFSKIVAYGACQDEDIWSRILGRETVKGGRRLGLATIPTYPSSGSDVDTASEMIEKATGRAGGLYGEPLVPDLCWLNPAYAMSLRGDILSYGVMASVVQASVSYLTPERSRYSEACSAALIRTELESLGRALEDPSDPEPRGELMIAACMAGQGASGLGKGPVDFSIYLIEGIIEQYRDLSYVPSLVILFPHWLRAVYGSNPVFRDYFREVWEVAGDGLSGEPLLEAGLSRIREAYRKFGVAWTLNELDPLKPDPARLRAAIAAEGSCDSLHRPFPPEDVFTLIREAEG
ncbi:MAG: iron-containing alcohol dehydrogenase [Sutterellaceae bacterium]|nr:iron-containing alcohol dehydrogenase [Sutterellaceae bacterium]MDD7442123.1 iron-containing alcohol dehydrogenase [Sutterellaceae bacterium]MDY2867132.1 iron-containing alcohol dehydrogenase [Mesosutterella sp.]